MSKVRVAKFSVSLDGFSAGNEQNLGDPLGKRGTEIFQWFFHTKSFCSMQGREGGTTGDVDDVFAHRAMENFGAFILGRNMFGPVRGPWQDGSWKGWWGDNPPYHAPTFVSHALQACRVPVLGSRFDNGCANCGSVEARRSPAVRRCRSLRHHRRSFARTVTTKTRTARSRHAMIDEISRFHSLTSGQNV